MEMLFGTILSLASVEAQSTPLATQPGAVQSETSQEHSPDDEIVVTAAPRDRNRVDRRSYEITSSSTQPAANARAVLKKIPGVTVSPDDVILLRGDPNLTITVDGKAPPPGFLDTLQAGQIAGVEVFTNPPASFDPGGTAGRINIIRRAPPRAKRFGGDVLAQFTMPAQKLFLLSARYNRNSLSMTGSGTLTGGRGPVRTYLAEQQIFQNGMPVSSYDKREKLVDRNLLTNVNLQTEYVTKGGATLDLSWAGSRSTARLIAQADYAYSSPTADFTEQRSQRDKRTTGNFNVSIQSPLRGTPFKLKASVSLDGSRSTNDLLEQFTGNAPFPAGQFSAQRSEHNSSRSAEVELSTPVRRGRALTLGTSLATYRTSVHSEDSSEGTGPSFFSGRESRGDVYGTYQFPLGKLSIQPGLRLEFTDRQFYATGTASHDFEYFPSLHIGLPMGHGEELKASYSRRLDRIALIRYDPARFSRSSTIVAAGNPRIKPQFVDSFELSFERIDRNKRFLATGYLRLTHDFVSDRSIALNGDRVLVQPFNFGMVRSGGLELNYMGPLFEHALANRMSLNLDANAFYEEVLDGDFAAGPARHGLAWSGSAQISFNLGAAGTNRDTVEMGWRGESGRLTAQGRSFGTSSLSATYSHSFNPRLAMSAEATTYLGRYSGGGAIESAAIRSVWRRLNYGPILKVTLVYRLPQ